MKKVISKLVGYVLMICAFLLANASLEVHAKEITPYTIGTTVTKETEKQTDYYSFTLSKRTTLKVNMSVLTDDSLTNYSSVNFYFERQNDDEEELYDYDEKTELKMGESAEITVTLEPGSYNFVASRYVSKYPYSFKISKVSEETAPAYSGKVVKDGMKLNVACKFGETFRVHNYQYDASKVYYYFSVPYRTQLDIEVEVKKNENYNYISSNRYYEKFMIAKDEDSYSPYYCDMDLSNGKTSDELFVDVGAKATAKITLEAGDYYLIQERETPRSDFSVKISKGKLNATSIKFEKKSVTIEPDHQMKLYVNTYTFKGTANVKYKTSNKKIVTVDKNGKITGRKEGKAVVTAYLPNGKKTKCNVKVKEQTALAKVQSQEGSYCYNNKINVWVEYAPVNTDLKYTSDLLTYRIYRSTSKNGKYKLIKTVKSKMGMADITDKNLKSNKKYYYKVSVKLEGEKKYGPLSKPVAYWTAPNPNVTITSLGTPVTWKKTKGATHYIVTEDWFSFQGYNIFGQKVFASCKHNTLVKGTNFTRREYIYYSSGNTGLSEIFVKSVAKHGKYYYSSGEIVTKKKADLETYDSHRYTS